MKKYLWNENWSYKKQGREEVRVLTLPHDAMLEEIRDPNSPGGSAAAWFQGGTYEYEKQMEVPKEWEQKHILLQFEGVYKNSIIRVNGKEIGGSAYGYIPFFVCLDGKVNYGETNTLQVIAQNNDMPNCRWYSGAGIYRPVWLWEGGENCILPEGVRITTLSYCPAVIRIEAEIRGEAERLEAEIYKDGQFVVKSELQLEEGVWGKEIELPNAELWSEETPEMYESIVNLYVSEEIKDRTKTAFGIRKVEWSEKGLFVNGKETLLRGGCIHHDHGILGAVSFKESEYRRVKQLKDAGYNAIRSSHNPASEAMLEACDRYGMYVMDETWDMWYNKKTAHDYANDFMENYCSDIRAMIRRDYNHPSVILYSVGNEISEPAKEKGINLAKEIVQYCHELDASRPVTAGINLMIVSSSAKGKSVYDEEKGGRDESKDKKMQGMNSTMFNMITSMVGSGMNKAANSKAADRATSPILDTLDIAGYNYASGRYAKEGAIHPKRIICGTETFPQDIAKNWEMVKKYPYLIGDFMWTAWDYLGEAGIGTWGYTTDAKGFDKPYPWLLADVGAIDILGNPNGELFWAQAAWGLLKEPKIAVQPVNHPGVKPIKGTWRGTNAIPSWSWEGCEGNTAKVEVYTTGEKVELFLNGNRIGKAKVKQHRAILKVKYMPGELQAVSYRADGTKLGESSLVSATGKISVRVTRESLAENQKNIEPGTIVYYTVELVGENGVTVSNADRKLTVQVAGGELLAFGSANPRTEESYLSGSFTTYYGKAQAVVRVTEPEKLEVTAY